MEKTNRELGIIIYSCQKNCDMWEYFSILFRKYWHDCPYPIVLVTDRFEPDGMKNYIFDEVVVEDSGWAQMIRKAMDVIETKYVSLWMDDYFLCDQVNNSTIEKYVLYMEKYHAANIRLCDSAFSVYQIDEADRNIAIYEQGRAYSITTQIGIWEKKFLKKYIKPEWSPWDFERRGSVEIIDNDYKFIGTLNYMFPYIEAVRKGKWMESGVWLCKRNGIELDYSHRPAMGNWGMCKIYLKGAILDLNPTLIVKIQNLLTKIKR